MTTQRRILSTNERLVIDLLLDLGPMTRPQLAQSAALSRPATGDLVARLVDRGLILAAGELETGHRGPNAMTYQVRPDLAYVVGIEMQPTYAKASVADITGRVLAEIDEPNGSPDQPMLDRTIGTVDRAVHRAGIAGSDIGSVVVGTPGVVGPRGDVDFVSGHDWGGGERRRLGDAFDCPVRLENDVNLAAIAEHRCGAGRGVGSLALVQCDEGLGAGLIVAGTLLRGAHGYAGELGYVPLGRHYDQPGSGFQSLIARAHLVELMAAHGLAGADVEGVLAGADGAADAFRHEVATRFALLSMALCAVVDPERIVFSGAAVAAGGERLMDAITTILHGMSPMRPAVVAAALGGHAVVAGAVAVALDSVRDTVFAGPSHPRKGLS